MDILEIQRENREYNEFKVLMEKCLKERKDAIEDFNRGIDLCELKGLGYEKAKELYEEIKYNLDYKNHRQDVEDVIKQLKQEKYTILQVAHYYPQINKLDILSSDKKRQLDEVLFRFKGSYLAMHSSVWYNLGFTEEVKTKVLDFLYAEGLLSKSYCIYCDCGEESLLISEQIYLDHKKYFEIQSKKYKGEATKGEILWYEEFEDYSDDRIWQIDCFHCDGREINSFKDMSYHRLAYKVEQMPDMTFANK